MSRSFLLRARLFFIEFSFAASLYVYLKSLTRARIYKVLFVAILINLISGLYQLFLNPTVRLTMLAYEPSMASMFYCTAVPIIFFMRKTLSRSQKLIHYLYIVTGLLIRSKIQYLALTITVVFYFLKKPFFTIYIFICLFFSLIFIFENHEYKRIPHNNISATVHATRMLYKHGLNGLSKTYEIGDSFTVRLSALYISLLCIKEHPLGIGFGVFREEFNKIILKNNLSEVFTGKEISEIYRFEQHATPKSFLLEIFVSSGILGILLFIYLAHYFNKFKSIAPGITYSFMALVINSAFVETAPLPALLVFLYALSKKISPSPLRKY